METMGLIFKVFWAPAEAMFLIAKKPRVLAPLLLLSIVSLGASWVTFSNINMTEVMISQAEKRGTEMTEERRAQMQQMARFMTPVFMASAAVGTAVIVTVAAAIY